MKRKTLAAALLVCWLGAAVLAAGQGQDPDRFFALEWAGGERRGKPTVNGYVVNHYRVGANNMRLRIEALDAAGKPVATTDAYVPDVPAGGRVYFETPVPQRAARYRVTITSWDWREAGGQ